MSQEIMAFLEDVFYTAKIREVARDRDRDVRFVRDLVGLDKRLSGPAPDLVLVDLTAPTLKPMDLIRRMKAQPEWGAARVVAYSPHDQAELMEEANQMGADIVLPKSELVQRLPELLASAGV